MDFLRYFSYALNWTMYLLLAFQIRRLWLIACMEIVMSIANLLQARADGYEPLARWLTGLNLVRFYCAWNLGMSVILFYSRSSRAHWKTLPSLYLILSILSMAMIQYQESGNYAMVLRVYYFRLPILLFTSCIMVCALYTNSIGTPIEETHDHSEETYCPYE